MILQKLGITIGKNTIAIMKELDKRRVVDFMRNSSEMKKKARQKKRQSKRKLEDTEEDSDNQDMELAYFKLILDLFH